MRVICCRRPTRSPTTHRPCSGTPTSSLSTRSRPGTPARTRAAALARHLQERYGLYLNGLILISCFLNGGSVMFTSGNDDPYLNYLPTYAAIANYHGKHDGRPLRDVLGEAEEYAAGEYPRLLALGSRIGAEERAAAVAKVAELTGLSQ